MNRTIKKVNLIISLGLIMMALLAGGFLIFNQSEKLKPVHREIPLKVTVQKIQQQENTPHLRVYGKVYSTHHATISSEIHSKIIKMIAYKGMHVKSGEKLAILDRVKQQAQVDIAQNHYYLLRIKRDYFRKKLVNDQKLLQNIQKNNRFAKNDFTRKKSLLTKGHLPTAAMEAAEKNLNHHQNSVINMNQSILLDKDNIANMTLKISSEKARLNIKKSDLIATIIRAPFDGIVNQVFVSQGELVNNATQIVDLYDDKNVKLLARIPVQYFLKMYDNPIYHKGISATSIINGKVLHWHSHGFSPVIDKNTASGEIELLTQPQHLLVGDIISTTIDLPSVKNSVKLPLSAIYDLNNKKYIYIVKDKRLSRLLVKNIIYTVDRSGKMKLILQANFHKGDQVLTLQANDAYDGRLVQIYNK